MSSTAEHLFLEEPSRPEERPDRRVAAPDDPHAARVPTHPEALEAPDFAGAFESSDAGAPSPSRLSVVVDELGQYVVQDVVGGAYGVGQAPEEAFADYWTALDQRLAFLRARRDALSARLARQLRELEELFPGR
jgi:hypothetical protein